MMPLPRFDSEDAPTSTWGGTMIGIPRASNNPDLAWKLIKLLYLADREALYRWGFSVTTDRYVSMDHGPVVSNIYNLIVTDEETKPFWSRYITPPLGEYEVALRDGIEVPQDQLSRAEESLLLEVFATYGTWNRWKLRDFTHDLPEWRNPNGSSIPIEVSEILMAQGSSEDEIRSITADMRAAEVADEVFGSRPNGLWRYVCNRGRRRHG